MSELERCPGCHPELPFTSHKRGIDETWRSAFQTAAKDLAAPGARPFAALRVTGLISKRLATAPDGIARLVAAMEEI